MNNGTTLTKIKPTIIKLLIILFFLGIFILITLLFSTNNKTETPRSQEKIEQPKTALKQKEGFDSELEKITKFLPYKGEGFSLEYVEALNLINAKIKADNVEGYLTIKNELEQFILSKEVEDICKLNIIWIAETSQDVRKSIDGKNFITTGCTP